jgi:arylsulfatase A-like enzyme
LREARANAKSALAPLAAGWGAIRCCGSQRCYIEVMPIMKLGLRPSAPRCPYKAWPALHGLLLVLISISSIGCWRPPPADNILFVSFDTTRADHLSAYGYEAPTSPNVDSLARDGVLYERAFTAMPSTLGAHTTMFTGLLPPSHGVRCNGRFRVPEAHTTLAETLSANGFDTGAILAALPLDRRFGLDQGFEVYDADFSKSAPNATRSPGRMDEPGKWLSLDYDDFERGADEVTQLAIEWLDARVNSKNDRWFLFAHYFDAHWPYQPEAPWSERFDIAYDAEISFMDEQFGRLMEKVRSMPGRTLVVFTADHGEGLKEHGEFLHTQYLYNSTLHVPLIISLEETTVAGLRVPQNVGHIDLLPTILELLNITSHPTQLAGRSLVPTLKGETIEPAQLYSETLVHKLENLGGTEVRALIDGDHKLITTKIDEGFRSAGLHRELYDMANDPGEIHLLGGKRMGETRRGLAENLDRLQAELERTAIPPEAIDLDEDAEAKLKALGYL